MTGMNGPHIIEHLGLTSHQYQSAAKRIRRKAVKLLEDHPAAEFRNSATSSAAGACVATSVP